MQVPAACLIAFPQIVPPPVNLLSYFVTATPPFHRVNDRQPCFRPVDKVSVRERDAVQFRRQPQRPDGSRIGNIAMSRWRSASAPAPAQLSLQERLAKLFLPPKHFFDTVYILYSTPPLQIHPPLPPLIRRDIRACGSSRSRALAAAPAPPHRNQACQATTRKP